MLSRRRFPLEVLRLLRAADRRAWRPLLAWLLPTTCFACGRPAGPSHRLEACARCWAALRPLGAPVCPSCGLPRPRTTDLLGPARGRCAGCILRPWPLEGIRPAVPYDEVARRFLLRAKLGRRRELLAPLGDQLARIVAYSGFAGGSDCVVPVPAHPWARLRRGFNPARELARVVARQLGLPLDGRSLVHRVAAGAPAKRLPAALRRARSRRFRGRRDLTGLRVLLVDDVLTTGATALDCASALRERGAREVRVAIWARTLPG